MAHLALKDCISVNGIKTRFGHLGISQPMAANMVCELDPVELAEAPKGSVFYRLEEVLPLIKAHLRERCKRTKEAAEKADEQYQSFLEATRE